MDLELEISAGRGVSSSCVLMKKRVNLLGGGTPLNNSAGMKGDRTIRKGICEDQPALTLQEIGGFPGCSGQPSGNKPGWGRLSRS